MTDAVVAREIAQEQTYVDMVYRQLEASADSAQLLAQEGQARGQMGHEGGLVERDAMVYQAARRIAALDAAHEGLVFGRLDLRPEVDAQPRYVGRIGLRDDNYDVLLIDWRAPAAAVFYQATPTHPQGVIRRRVLRSKGMRVVGLEDDLLDADANDELVIVGEGALLAQLSRARDRRMHSIVATIQAEQDRAIRAPAKGIVSISGGPGTGKTVVALHRVAYLLYTDRDRYQSGGVLVVGPSGVFMRYIERVLPSLGETAVSLRALGEVVDGVATSHRDDPRVAAIKGSARMARVLQRLVRQPVPGAPTQLRYFYRDQVIGLDPAVLAQLRRHLLHRRSRNRSTTVVATTLLEAMWEQVTTERALERGVAEFAKEVRTDGRFLEFAHRWWPVLDATTVLNWLRDEQVVATVADGLLDADEQKLLAASFGDQPSIEDVALIDELRYLLGEVPDPDDPDEEPLGEADVELAEFVALQDAPYPPPPGWGVPDQPLYQDGYAHVLVDEAQDLTPMQWRMVGRRGRAATWTIVGDVAQSSWPYPDEAERARDAALFALNPDKPVHEFHLSTNYRNSAEIFEFAAAYAREVGLQADLPRAVRATGVAPQQVQGPLKAHTHAAVVELMDAVDGTIGVVTPAHRKSEVAHWLATWPETAALTAGADARIVALTGLETKGLEFDAIVVVDPAGIETESPTGTATLYVVYTRATQQLTIVKPDSQPTIPGLSGLSS